jgi:ribonuclease PH
MAEMMNSSTVYVRKDGRTPDQLRPVSISHGVYDFASGSVLFTMGKTKVLCAVSIQNGVPPFLRGKGTSWLTAEYALLPMSTATRTQRESTLARKDGRSVEIARFIGRCFRSVVDLSLFGEKTITIDCDVLQADGGTRTASITGAFLALSMAQEKWLASRLIDRPFIKEKITAVSVGVVAGHTLLDLNYDEDSNASADFNFVITESDKIIEMQGGAESSPLSWDLFDDVRNVARHGAKNLFELYNNHQLSHKKSFSSDSDSRIADVIERVPLFSLKNRQHSS